MRRPGVSAISKQAGSPADAEIATSQHDRAPARYNRVGKRSRRRRAQISLTPLIDIVFILLIFFMLATSFLDWQSIRVAGGVAGEAASGLDGALLVDIDADRLRLSGEAMPAEELSRRVADRLAVRPDQRVVVRPAPGVDVQRTVAILDRLTAAGVESLVLTGPALTGPATTGSQP